MGSTSNTHDVAGTLLADARHRAGMSQVELANRAGLTQSVISDYERGRRQPSLPTLMSLIDATGHRLVTDLEPDHGPDTRRPSHRHAQLLARHRVAVLAAAAHHGARNVRVFGSTARNEDHAASDIDLLVDLGDDAGLIALAALQRELQEILGVPVDVVPASSLKAELGGAVTESIPL